jgi:hypothetical protein
MIFRIKHGKRVREDCFIHAHATGDDVHNTHTLLDMHRACSGGMQPNLFGGKTGPLLTQGGFKHFTVEPFVNILQFQNSASSLSLQQHEPCKTISDNHRHQRKKICWLLDVPVR